MMGMAHQDQDQLRATDAATLLLNHLRSTIGGAPTVDVGQFMERYFFNVKRDKGEPMSSYVARTNNACND